MTGSQGEPHEWVKYRQYTWMYSAHWASQGLIKFDPIEFSTFHFIQAVT